MAQRKQGIDPVFYADSISWFRQNRKLGKEKHRAVKENSIKK